jgi:TetR/AcrR family transcriptional regulator, regulator of biofilm formation and stress response
VHDAPAVVEENKKDVEAAKGRGGHGEEVDGRHGAHVTVEESASGQRWRLAWLGRHEAGNASLADVDAEFEQLPMDSGRSPEWIGLGHLADERLGLRGDLTVRPRVAQVGQLLAKSEVFERQFRTGSEGGTQRFKKAHEQVAMAESCMKVGHVVHMYDFFVASVLSVGTFVRIMVRPPSPAILDATLKLIAKGGVDAVRYRDVASESGVPLGTISYQYPSREELIRSAFKHFLAANETSLRRLAAGVRLREPRDVAKLIADILEDEFKSPDRIHLSEFELLVYAARDPQMAEMLAEWDRRLTAELGAILETVGVQAPFATAETLLELSRGFQLVRLGQEKPNFAELRQRIERVLHALGVAAASASDMSPKTRQTKRRS